MIHDLNGRAHRPGHVCSTIGPRRPLPVPVQRAPLTPAVVPENMMPRAARARMASPRAGTALAPTARLAGRAASLMSERFAVPCINGARSVNDSFPMAHAIDIAALAGALAPVVARERPPNATISYESSAAGFGLSSDAHFHDACFASSTRSQTHWTYSSAEANSFPAGPSSNRTGPSRLTVDAVRAR